MGFIFGDGGGSAAKPKTPAAVTPATPPVQQALPGSVSQRAAARYGATAPTTATPALVAPAQSELVSLLGGGG